MKYIFVLFAFLALGVLSGCSFCKKQVKKFMGKCPRIVLVNGGRVASGGIEK